MADVVDSATRSRMMAGIGRRDTKIEITLRRALHSRGFRYRVDDRRLPGRPDIVLPRWNVVIFVHGCFWHAHDCGLCRIPATRPDFWRVKLEGNVERDARNHQALADAGWRIATVWECATRGQGADAVESVADTLEAWLRSGSSSIVVTGNGGKYA